MDDAALMQATARGDAQAFSGLVDRHADRIMAMAQTVLGSVSEAEDVTQEVFVTLWKRAGDWDPARSRLSTWLFQITRHAALNYLQRTRGRETLWHDDAPDVASDAPTPESAALVADQRQQLTTALHTLPPAQRSALYLTVYEELSNREAAAAMAVSVKALEALLVRARRQLRDYFVSTDPPPSRTSS